MVSESQKRRRRKKRMRSADPNQVTRENQRRRYCGLGLHNPVDPGTYDPPALRDVTINSIRDGTDEWDFKRPGSRDPVYSSWSASMVLWMVNSRQFLATMLDQMFLHNKKRASTQLTGHVDHRRLKL